MNYASLDTDYIHADYQASVESEIDRSSPLPLYYQIKQILLKHIQNGDINPGELLPSEKELEEQYKVSRITVRRALQDLVAEGYIMRQAGRGSFVRKVKLQDRSEKLGGFADDLEAQGYKVESQILNYGRCPAMSHIAQKLGVEIGKSLLCFERLVRADDEPIAIATAYFDVAEHVIFTPEELSSTSIFPLLEQKYGIVLQRAQKSIEVTVALEDEAKLLHISPNGLLMLTELIIYDEQGQCVGFVKTLYRGDRYKYYITLTR